MNAKVIPMAEQRENLDPADAKNSLLRLIVDRCFKVGDFKLSSHKRSKYYIDGKQIEFSGEGLTLYNRVLWEMIKDEDFNSISGLATGSIALTAASVLVCYLNGRSDVEGTFVRSEIKEHGTRREIEGQLPQKAKVIVLDDVVTTGKSVLKAIDALEEAGAKIVKVIALVDRQEGAQELFQVRGYEYAPMFTRDDLVEFNDNPGLKKLISA